MSETNLAERQIKVERLVDAPVDLVFEVWTKPEHLDKWWGPSGYTTTTQSFLFQVGGEWIYQMKHDQHGDFPNFTKYVEIVPNEKIVYDHGAHKNEDFWFQSVATFEETEGKTKVTLVLTFPTKEACEQTKKFGAESGGHETLKKLEQYVKRRM